MRAVAHVGAGPEAAEAFAAPRQLADERGQARVLGKPADGQSQVPGHIEGAFLPVRV
jgi:hypothetical protein